MGDKKPMKMAIFLIQFLMMLLMNMDCGVVGLEAPVDPGPDIIPETRLYEWGAYCGIPGGIPQRTTIYATLQPGATAAQITAAINACPSGQVVYLSAGTFNLGSGRITWPRTKSGVTLRGAGAGRTIITGNTTNIIDNSYTQFNESSGISVVSGYAQGSTSIVLGSSPSANFAAGNLMVIGEDSSRDKFGDDIGTYARDGLATTIYNTTPASRCFKYLVRIAGVSGNTIHLAAPIPVGFSAGLNIKAYPQANSGCATMCGMEDFTLYNVGDPIKLYTTDRFWVKGVEFDRCPYGDVGALHIISSFQFEVRGCYFHDAPGWPNQVDGICVGVNYGVCNGLFIDNISHKTSALFEINGASANAFLFNYEWGTARAANQMACIFPMFYHHGPHCMMNLFEGNIGTAFSGGGYHGSDSHGVVFRNNFCGLHPLFTDERKMINLPRGSYYYSIVGNVLGDPSWNPDAYSASGSFGHSYGTMYVLGYPNTGNSSMTPATTWSTHPNVYPDAAVAATILRHGNYDYFHKDVVWDDGIASRALPDSLFYTGKPAFFGSLPWPAIGPDVTGRVSQIPARARWEAYMTSNSLIDIFKE